MTFTTGDPPVFKWESVYMPISDEAIVDYGLGSPDEIAAAADRIDAAIAESTARWKARPVWRRAALRAEFRARDLRARLSMAWDVLRNRHECDR